MRHSPSISMGFWLLLVMPVQLLAQVPVTGCGQPGCIGCDELDRCTRCTRAIVHGTRQCVTACPGNYRLVHSDVTGYQGLLCRAHRFLDTADLTTTELSALVAALLVAAVCIGLAIGAFMYLRLRRKMDPLRERLHHRDPDGADLERVQFVTRLRALRPDLATLLSLLTEPRPLSRHSTDTGTARTSGLAYRTSQQDLRRLIVLLSSRDQQLRRPPADWERLLSWAERLVRQQRQQKLNKSLSSSAHIEYLPRVATPGSRRTRSAAGRPLTSTGGSFFSLSQTVIEEEEEAAAGTSSLPPAGARAAPRPGRATPQVRPRRPASGRGRGRPADRRRRTDSAPGDLTGPAVFLHRLNGGHGAVWGLPGGRPGSAPISGGVSTALTATGSAPAPAAALRPATTEPRPTYRDWPRDRLRHFSHGRSQLRPRPRPRPRPRRRQDGLPAGGGGGGGGGRRSADGGGTGLLWPPPPAAGSAGLHNDVLEQDGASFGGRYLHPQDLSTVL